MIEVGQHNKHHTPTMEASQMAFIVKPMVEKQTSMTYKNFELIEHTTQVVNGILHKMKIKVGDEEYIHLKVIENPQGGLTVNEISPGKKMNDML